MIARSYATYKPTDTIESLAVDDPPSPARYAEWLSVWTRCAQLEKGFWDMGLHLL